MQEAIPGGGERTVGEKLLSAAVTLFARKGYAATTVREIVDAAGVTKPVLYYHFGSKEGIYLALMNRARGEFEATLDAALTAGSSAWPRIVQVLGDALDLILANLDVVRVVHAVFYGPPQGAPFFDFEAFHEKLVGSMHTLVAEGIASGELAAGVVDDITWAVLGAFDTCQGMSLHHPELGFDRSRLERVLEVIFRGVRAADTKEL